MINFTEILWKPRKGGSHKQSAHMLESAPELQRVIVEEVVVTPECRVAMVTDPRSPAADRFRFLRMKLREVKDAVQLRSIVVTSALPQDGKSTTALNLATALNEKGKRKVLLIEADLYHPTLATRLGLSALPGLAECLEEDLNPLDSLRRIEPLGFYLLPAGTTKSNPTELLQQESLPRVLQTLTPLFDWVIIDTPPVAPLTDAILLSRHVDASMLVVRAGHTPEKAVEEAVNLLGKSHVLGIIFNCAEGLDRLYSAYYGYYGKKS